ncbi:hypothetical protein SOVF_092320 [Spinacia oleracea]|uniref:Uncharacterized protein LOC110796620 n=1 Tax=Spinacia oleracea TaxID=3562 RepID=A0A9R0K4M8_SPIOL|nr:uncharacterized protein LOC110796620 [Spinacia oleracea]XP_021857384.1 uncharacterized protein LOC110796620 [Spinacia oleracea]XP_021857385.1 uncharacterized protein LOC110796620 [Spinacia oleracea]XP_056692866.1 uncharacterized protein LOC110796620 [Spinacia oleracea]KNA16070.1 hypothetical protein SOVF_092320 [Spinacia oleracea]
MAEQTDAVPGSILSTEASKSGEEKSPDHSAGKLRGTKKVPHYLRASTGSCHDSCKHGTSHKFKDTPTRPVRRKILPHGKNTVDIQIYVDKKVKKALQADNLELPSADETSAAKKSFPSSRKSSLHDSSKLIKQEPGSKLVKKVVQSPGKSSLSDTLKISKQDVVSSKKRVPLCPKERNASEGPLKPNSRGKKPSSLSSTIKISNPEVTPAAIKSVSSKRTAINSKGKIDSEVPLKPSGRCEKRSSSLGSLTRLSKTNVGDNPRTSRPAVMKTATLSPRTSKVEVNKLKDQKLRSQAFVKNQIIANKAKPVLPNNDKVEEKTLHMIETKEDYLSTAPNAGILDQSPWSPESLNSSSQTNSLSLTSHGRDSGYTDSEAEGSVSNYSSSGDSKAADSLNKGKELTHVSEGRDPASLKMKFKKGKMVEHQSETNTSRRLRFRKGRTLVDSQDTNSGAHLKTYKKRASENNKKEAETGLVKVFLKHQETETKKEEQVSLNNVIEETASKLVEKRKSRVKALVGAFESVISLQERKPSAADR